MANLFSPLTIRSVTLRNRIVVSPMCQYSSVDGLANDWHLVHLGAMAVGGAGLVITEATAVSPEGRISPADLGLWKDTQITPLQRITSFIAAQGAVPGIQLAHAGRKASAEPPWKGGRALLPDEGGWTTLAPSALPFKPGELLPVELSTDEIARIIADFKQAARRALVAGFKVVELHGAHGYLIHEFLSPKSNLRHDNYGGSFNNRCRFLLEMVTAVREVWPDELPLFVRISATEWVEGGWTLEDSVALAVLLQPLGVDLVDCSTGGNVSGVKIALKPLYQLEFAEQLRARASVMTGAVGLITTPEEAEMIITEGKADLVFMARELLRDPHFPLRAAHVLGHHVDWPPQYERARHKPVS